MVEGGMKCVKYLIFAFNFVFFLAGIALIVAGALVETKFREEYDFFGSKFNAVAVFVIVVGAIIFLIGFFGCCGAWKENYCMTMTFAVLLGLIFIFEIGGGIAAFVFRNQIKDEAGKVMKDSMKNYWKDVETNKVTKSWNLIQHDFKCCGANSSADWKDVTGQNPPKSCCKAENSNCTTTDSNMINTKGCVNGFVEWAKDKIVIIGGVGIGLAFVQVLGVILACCLARTIKKEYEVV